MSNFSYSNRPRPTIFFNCGELRPTSFRYEWEPPINGPNPPRIVKPRPPIIIPPFPQSGDGWVCICRTQDTNGSVNNGCLDESERECVPRINAPAGVPAGPLYSSKAQCEDSGFGRPPCALSVHRCVRQSEACPKAYPPRVFVDGVIIRGNCVEDLPAKFRPVGAFRSRGACLVSCLDSNTCRYRIDEVPRPLFKCNRFRAEQCDSGETTASFLYASGVTCVECTPEEIRTNPECIYTSRNCDDPGAPPCRDTRCGTKCIDLGPKVCPITTLDGELTTRPPNINPRIRKCIPCLIPSVDPLRDAGCTNETIAQCRTRCISDECPPVGPITPGGGGGGGGGSTGTPTTTVGISNQSTVVVIPTGSIGTNNQSTVTVGSTGTVATRGETNTGGQDPQLDKENELRSPPLESSFNRTLNVNPKYNCEVNNGVRGCYECTTGNCQYQSLNDCLIGCFSENPNFRIKSPSITTNLQSVRFVSQEDFVRYSTLGSPIPSNLINYKAPSTENPKLNSVKIVGGVPRYIKTINLNPQQGVIYVDDNTREKVELNKTAVYDTEYNIFNFTSDNLTRLTSNSLRLDIFNNTVAEEVSYFLRKYQDNTNDWSEKYYFNLTPEKLSLSLRKDLNDALQSIHYPDNTLIPQKEFLETLKSLLISGRLNEFDPNFYIELSRQQANDELLLIEGTVDEVVSEQASLTLTLNGVQPTKEDIYKSANKFRVLRQKRLNTDIGVKVDVELLDGSAIQIPFEDAGITAESIASTEDAVPVGVGDGYFLDVSTLQDTKQVPLDNLNDFAVYTPEAVRFTALKAVNDDPYTYLTVSSSSSYNEFLNAYSIAEVDSLFFELDLSTAKIVNDENSLINEIHGTYKLVTSQYRINKLLINYGFNISKVCLDYRDPLFTYAYTTSSFETKVKDVTFRNFDFYLSGNYIDDRILTRNIPFAIVLVPGCGSRHNPFNNESEITSIINNNIVVRQISVMPTIRLTDYGLLDDSLLEYETDETVSPPPDYYGYSTKLFYNYDPSNYVGTYYYNGEYRNSRPVEITNTQPILGKIIKEVVDPLIQSYSPRELKWFDIFSRLTYDELGQYILSNGLDTLKSYIKNTYDISVKDVLATDKDSKTGLIVTDDFDDSVTTVRNQVVTSGNRKNILYG